MPSVDFTAPIQRVLLPFCYVIHRSDHWTGVCRVGAYEVHTPKRFGTRAAALADAKRIAATLIRNDAGGAL